MSIRRASLVGLVLGIGLGLGAWPALASDKHHDSGGGWHPLSDHDRDHDADVWGLEEAGDDGPARGLDVTGHGPAWGVHGDDDAQHHGLGQ